MASIIVDLLVPGVGSATNALRMIMKLCNDIKEGEDTCRRLHRRLADILDELAKMEAARRLPPSDALARYSQMLLRYIQYLQRYREKGIVSRVICQSKMMEEIKVLNEEVDMLMRILNLATTGAMMDWKQQWEADRITQRRMMDKIVENDANVLGEIRGVRAQMEAMTQLKFQMEQRQAQQSKETRDMMKKLFVALVRTSSAGVPPVPSWFLPAHEVQYDPESFASGSFGAVHRGTWGAGTNVVVKVLTVDESGMNDATMAKFMDEVNIWHTLHHPHIVKMFGASHITVPPFIVCEDATNGNLVDFLSKPKTNKQQMWKLLYQAALGLEYLHRNLVVHGDLKLNNILVGSDGQARLADFGLSAVRSLQSSLTATATATANGKGKPATAGGLRWRAPECFRRRPQFTSDVYSFAMCIIEAATDEPPFAFLSDGEVHQLVVNGTLPEQPDELADDAWALVESMTRLDPAARAPLHEVLSKLKELVDKEAKMAAAAPAPTPSEMKQLCKCERRPVEIDGLCTECWMGQTQTQPQDTSSLTRTSRARLPTMGGRTSTYRVPMPGPPPAPSAARAAAAAAAPIGALRMSSSERTPPGHRSPSHQADRLTATSPGQRNSVENLIRARPAGGQQRDIGMSQDGFGHQAAQRSPRMNPRGIPELVMLTQNGTDDEKEQAARDLAHRAMKNTANREAIADEGGIIRLVRMVARGTPTQKEVAALALGNLALKNEPNCVAIADADGIAPIAMLLKEGTSEQKEQAAHVFGKLAYHNDANRVAIVKAGCIEPLVKLIARGTEKQKELAAVALSNLALKNEANCAAITRAGAIPPLIELVRLGTDSQVAHAALALGNLAMKNEANRIAIARAGGISPLVRLLRRGNDKQKEYAALAVGNLLLKNDDNRVTIANAGAIPPFVELIKSGNDGQKAHAALALGNLAAGNGQNCVTISQSGGVTPLVELVRNGNADHKDRAAFALGRLAQIPGIAVRIVDAGGKSALDDLASRGNESQKVRAKEALSLIKAAGGSKWKLFGK